MSEPSEVEIAWAAGIIEGEGTIYAPSWKYAPRCVAVCMTDEDVIERLDQIFPCPGVRIKTRGSERNRKEAFVWQVGAAADIRNVLESVFTYLGERRKGQAMALLRALDEMPGENGWERRHGCK